MAVPALFGVDMVTQDLLQIDPATGAQVVIGNMGQNFYGGLTYDAGRDILYGHTNSALYAINRSTGASAFLRNTYAFTQAIAYDSSTDTLYASSTTGLYTIDPAASTGFGNYIGTFGGNQAINGMTYDPVADVLYGIGGTQFASQPVLELRTIDRMTAAVSAVGSLFPFSTSHSAESLAFDVTAGMFTITSDDALRRIDPLTGLSMLVATSMGSSVIRGAADLRGLVFAPAVISSAPSNAIPEPGALTLVGLAVLGISNRRRVACARRRFV